MQEKLLFKCSNFKYWRELDIILKFVILSEILQFEVFLKIISVFETFSSLKKCLTTSSGQKTGYRLMLTGFFPSRNTTWPTRSQVEKVCENISNQ